MADTIVADLIARLRADTTDFKKGLDDAEGATQSFSQRMGTVGKSMMRTGALMTAGITAPLAIVGKVAFDATSDLNESLNKVDVVFAENAVAIKKWSESAATSLGMSRRSALEAAGTFGNLFSALGVGAKPAADMSKQLVQLAADLASFNNANPEEVLLALRSGLVGEVEPLRKFGVSLSAARVEAKAFQMGLAEADGTLSDAAKTQARYAIILEDTTLAQGDFERTADGAANKQRILKAQFEDTAAALGTALIPIFQKVAGVLQDVAQWFSNLSPAQQEMIVYAGLAVAALGPLTTAIGAVMTAVRGMATVMSSSMMGVLGPWGIVIGLAAGALYGLSQALGGNTRDLDVNVAAIQRLSDAQMHKAAVDIISKLGVEGLTEVIRKLAAESTTTAQALLDAATVNGRARADLQRIIDQEAEATARATARTQADAEAKNAAAAAANNAAAAVRGLTAAHAQSLLASGFAPEGYYEGTPEGMSRGGWVGGTGNRDTVPAMLTPGEFVLSKDMLAGRAPMPAGVGGGGPSTIVIPLTLDGRLITEVVVSNLNRAGGPKISQKAVA